jgi:tRNA wybutosine-synthesizing protein 2
MKVRVFLKEQLAMLSGQPWVDERRRPHVEGGLAYVPVREGYHADHEIPERSRYCSRGYYMTGDIAVLHGKPPTETELEEIIRWKKPRGIVLISSSRGIMRIPVVQVLYGDIGETVHREGGISYRYDPSKVMFAMGNRVEKERLSSLVQKGEKVADMCAGIGYFTLSMAKAGAMVDAAEINPVSFRYLEQNIMENGLADRVRCRCGDSRASLDGMYDRVVIGHFESRSFIPALKDHLHPGSTVHCHVLSDNKETVDETFADAGYEVRVSTHRVKKYRPHIWHEVLDCEVTGYADA